MPNLDCNFSVTAPICNRCYIFRKRAFRAEFICVDRKDLRTLEEIQFKTLADINTPSLKGVKEYDAFSYQNSIISRFYVQPSFFKFSTPFIQP